MNIAATLVPRQHTTRVAYEFTVDGASSFVASQRSQPFIPTLLVVVFDTITVNPTGEATTDLAYVELAGPQLLKTGAPGQRVLTYRAYLDDMDQLPHWARAKVFELSEQL